MGEPQSGREPILSEWGNPPVVMHRDPPRWEVSGGTETSHVPRGSENSPGVVASETGSAQTSHVPSCQALHDWGCEPIPWGLTPPQWDLARSTKCLERHTTAGDSPVVQGRFATYLRSSTTRHEKSRGKLGRPRPKATYWS